MKERAPHWLQPGGKTKTPNVVVTFDTETSETDAGDHSVQKLRCWDAMVRVRKATTRDRKAVTYHEGEMPATLADVVEDAAQIDTECWVVAHNVGFDLAVSSLPFILSARGWVLDAVNLGDESSWWIMKRDGHKIIITDSWSWLRCSLGEAAKDLSMRKLPLPTDDDELDVWHSRCRHDVEILDRVMTTLMNWWDEQQLGVFGITGAACGWRTLRAIVQPKKLLVGRDGERTDFERQAVFSGKKDVYGVGNFKDVWIADYDFVSAYTTAAAAFPLPMMPAKRWCSTAELLDNPPPPQRDYIAEVFITTKVPCAPCRIDGEIWWPVGTFRTTLTGPEIRYVQTVADSVDVVTWEAYRTGYALADWAAWCLKMQSAAPHQVPPVVARVAKNWGRLAIGKFAARTSRVIATRPSTHLGWHLETGHDLDTGARVEWLSMGGVEQTIAKDLDASDIFPAVLAFIEAHTRVALGQMMATRDPANLLQCNTDGWWEMRAPRLNDHTPDNVPWPFRVTRKALERSIVVRGPNHVMTPHERRYAGIPADATGADGEAMAWRDWPSLRWQLEHSVTGEYRRPDRDAILSEHFVRRWVLDSGETIPVTAYLDDDVQTAIEPWSRSWGRRANDVLTGYQVPVLNALLETDTEPAMRANMPLPVQPGRDIHSGIQRVLRPKPKRRRSAKVSSSPEPEPLMYLDSL